MIYFLESAIMFLMDMVYWLYIFCQMVGFYLSLDCLINGITSIQTDLLTDNTINQQLKFYLGH